MKTLSSLFLFLLLIITGCDPGMYGDMKVYNETNQAITIRALDHGATDSTTLTVEPHGVCTVEVFNGLGNKKEFDCCPCELQGIRIFSTNGNIKKDPSAKINWIIPNKSKLKRLGGQGVKCEFHVTQSDL